jgi:hypothetical protein
MASRSVSRLLTRHFLRRFFENDLISPHVDLHENTAMASAAVVSSSLFLSVVLGAKYLMGASPPGVVAVESLGDNYAFVTIAMLGMALVAALQWDALSLDVRDASNLGPLPISRTTLVRSKLSALAIFAIGFALALNVFPSLVLQTGTTARMPVGFSGLVRLVFAHAAASMLAGAFGFLSVVALRELFRALLRNWFSRISAVLQGALVLASMVALLLTPVTVDTLKRSWLSDGFPTLWTVPPVWFMGLEQTLGGGVIANVSDFVVAPRLAAPNARALALYHDNVGFFRECAPIALASVPFAFVIAALAYAWNLRQMPQPVPSARRRRSSIAMLSAVASGGDSVRRAGTAFALRALVRSAPHRLSMAAAAALAIAMSIGLLGRTGFRAALDPRFPPASVIAVQTVMLTILLAGFRRAVRVPAELKANWIIQMTWRDGERRFMSGVKRAALVGIAAPVLVMLFPLHVWITSGQVAVTHFLIGLCYSLVVVETLFLGCTKVPFASSYEPLSHVKTLGPIVFVLFLIFVNAFARAERAAVGSIPTACNFALVLVAAFAAVRIIECWRARGRRPMQFDEPPEPATQWLGLSG